MMTAARRRKKLARMWHAQNGLCCYCGLPTWLHGSGETKDQARAWVGIVKGTPGSGVAFHRRKATIEHFDRTTDGGSDEDENLGMACGGCNWDRGDTPVEEHKAAMRAKYAGQRQVAA